MKTIGKGMCWVIRDQSNEQMITRCFDQGEDATVKTKQCGPKLFGSQARFVCEAKCAGNHTRDSRAPDG